MSTPVTPHAKWRTILPIPTGKALGVLLLTILTLLLAIALLEWPVLHHTHGNILFPHNNAYLNITVARNLAFYQVWGVSKYAFQSAASSLLYPFALAPVFFLFGAHLVIPLIVNFLAGAYFLLVLQKTLIRYGLPPARQFLLLLAAMTLTLLPLLVASGMEYTLQLLFVYLFMDALVQTLSAATTPKPPAATTQKSAATTSEPPATTATKTSAPLYIFGFLAVAARYEDLLVIALACALLGRQKGWKPAAKLAAISVSPVVVFGVISLIKKNYFLPNSMLVGPYPTYSAILALIATAAATWLIIRYRSPTPEPSVQTQHIPPEPHAQTHHITPKPPSTRKIPSAAPPALAILILLLIPFTARNAANLAHFTQDCDHIYDEQYLTAHFVHLYYLKQTVGTNQPGAISYFSEGRKLDYTGVASNDVVRMTRKYGWTPLYADSLSKKDGIRVAIIADPWFPTNRFPKWTRIATWNIDRDSPPKKINFYAVEPYDTTWLRKRLHEFQHLLPPTASVKYY